MKIQLTILCGVERTNWVCPELYHATATWLTKPAKGPKGEPVDVLFRPAIGYRQSQIARNDACKWAIDNEVDYLVMIDNDTVPYTLDGGTVDIVQMCCIGVPIVAAPIPVIKGEDDWHLNAYELRDGSYYSLSPQEMEKATAEEPLIEVDAVGFGLVCIRLDVIKSLSMCTSAYHIEGGNVSRSDCPPGYPVHRNRAWDGRTELGEDLLFCLRAKQERNYLTYVVPSQMCGHYHTLDFLKVPQIGFPKSALDYGILKDPPPITNYTMQPVILDFIRRHILTSLDIDMSVLELGSGMSTLVIQAAFKHSSRSFPDHVAVEEDEEVAREVNAVSLANGWRDAVLHLPLKGGFYDGIGLPLVPPDLLIVDGPSEAAGGDRTKCLPLIEYMDPGSVVVFDDWARPNNREAIDRWIGEGIVTIVRAIGRAVILKRM